MSQVLEKDRVNTTILFSTTETSLFLKLNKCCGSTNVDDLDVEIDRRTVEEGRTMLESTGETIGGVSC